MAALVALATDDVRPGLATTGDAGSRDGPDVAGSGRSGRGGAQQPPDTAAQIDLMFMVQASATTGNYKNKSS